MFNIDDFIKSIFDPSLIHFDELALKAFAYQYDNNVVYQQYCKLNKILDKQSVTKVAQIPFLPIQFFKTHAVISGTKAPEIQFTSSSTGGQGESRHLVVDSTVYTKSFFAAFEHFYGPITDYCFLALLPSYLERTGSSLLLMCDELIKASNNPLSNFYLYNHEQLANVLLQLKGQKQKTILIGATFALLDFSEIHHIDFPELIVMETGGMKGRRKEITRAETHALLADAFAVTDIHSEYGMTELLSQAYSKGNGVFECPAWMQVKISDPTDPFTFSGLHKSGVINVIDLANINSCCFIQTQDLGKLSDPGSFEVLGRLDNSDIRGCSLLTV